MDEPEEIDEAEAAAAYRQEVEAAGQVRLFPEGDHLRVINRVTGAVDLRIPISEDERSFTGLVENQIASYEGTEWYAERSWTEDES